MLVVVMLCGSKPTYAGKQKAFDKYDPPSDLILALPDQLLITKKVSQLNDQKLVTDISNATQTASLKRIPVNVNCDVDVIQNILGDVPLASRIFGKCGLHYHY